MKDTINTNTITENATATTAATLRTSTASPVINGGLNGGLNSEWAKDITPGTSLGEILEMLGDVERLPKTPKKRQLMEMTGGPMAEYEGCYVFDNGYALYENGSGRTTMWLPDCVRFIYQFTKLRDVEKIRGLREYEEIPEELMREMSWVVVLTTIGGHRIENLSLSRKGDRAGSRADLYDETNDENREEPLRREYVWKDAQFGEDPETSYIRKETLARALASMTDKQREAFLLYYRDGYTQKEIGEMYGIDHTAILRHLERAVKKIKKFF